MPFVPNQSPNETYQARWTRSQYGLEILMAEVGVQQPREHHCTLRLAIRKLPSSRPIRRHCRMGFRRACGSAGRIPTPRSRSSADGLSRCTSMWWMAQRTEDGAADHGWGTANLPVRERRCRGREYSYDCSCGSVTKIAVDELKPGALWRSAGQLAGGAAAAGLRQGGHLQGSGQSEAPALSAEPHIVVPTLTSSAAQPGASYQR